WRAPPLLSGECARARPAGDEVAQGGDRRGIGDAVDALGAEMTLEGGNHRGRRLVVSAVDGDVVAVHGEHRLQRLDRLAALAGAEEAPAAHRCRAHEMADAGAVEFVPGKAFAGIELALRGDVRMAEHAVGRNGPAGDDVAAERDDGGDLRRG